MRTLKEQALLSFERAMDGNLSIYERTRELADIEDYIDDGVLTPDDLGVTPKFLEFFHKHAAAECQAQMKVDFVRGNFIKALSNAYKMATNPTISGHNRLKGFLAVERILETKKNNVTLKDDPAHLSDIVEPVEYAHAFRQTAIAAAREQFTLGRIKAGENALQAASMSFADMPPPFINERLN